MITTTKADSSTAEYQQFRVSGDRAEFIGPDASDLNTDALIVRSTAPKRGNNQYGNRRSLVTLNSGTSVVDLEGNPVVLDRRLAVESSFPVGTTLNQIVDDCAKLASLLQDASFVEQVFKTGIIEF